MFLKLCCGELGSRAIGRTGILGTTLQQEAGRGGPSVISFSLFLWSLCQHSQCFLRSCSRDGNGDKLVECKKCLLSFFFLLPGVAVLFSAALKGAGDNAQAKFTVPMLSCHYCSPAWLYTSAARTQGLPLLFPDFLSGLKGSSWRQLSLGWGRRDAEGIERHALCWCFPPPSFLPPNGGLRVKVQEAGLQLKLTWGCSPTERSREEHMSTLSIHH